MSNDNSATKFEEVIRRYYEGCNAADRAMMMNCLSPDAAHYFPGGAPQGTFEGAAAIADGWIDAVRRMDSRWTIDSMLVDVARSVAAVEWTHFKPALGVLLRGAEFFRFDDAGRIAEIRAYYACPAVDSSQSYELGDFDYFGRQYPLDPPTVQRMAPAS